MDHGRNHFGGNPDYVKDRVDLRLRLGAERYYYYYYYYKSTDYSDVSQSYRGTLHIRFF